MKSRDKRAGPVHFAVAIAVGLAVCASLYRAYANRPLEETTKAPPTSQVATTDEGTQNDLGTMISTCRVSIRQMLKDPDSAEFVNLIDQTPFAKLKNGEYSVRPMVRAMSAHGYGVHEFNCRMQKQAGEWAVVELSEH